MGNQRFRLSELIPNAWFYKLRDMGRSRKHSQNAYASPSPKSKQHTVPTSPPKTARSPRPRHPTRRSLHSSLDPPRKSATHRLRRRSTSGPPPKRLTSAVTSGCICRTKAWSGKSHSSTSSGDGFLTGGTFSPELPDDSPCSCSSKAAELRPIITRPPAKKQSTEPRKLCGRKTTSPGVRLRLSSPRVSVSRLSTAVVKASVDPRRDFKESMVEMIVENNIRASKDLEELLACYLCLNSDEYHHIIITVFKQIWLDLNSSCS